MRSRLLAFSLLSAALTGLLLGCGGNSPPPAETPGVAVGDTGAKADIGSPLYPPVAAPAYAGRRTRGEPLVIPNCVVQYEDRQVVAAEVDGTVVLFATPFKPGEFEKLTADEKAEQVVYHPHELKVPLKRVRESMAVEGRQVLAYLDSQLVTARMDGATKIKKSALKGREYAQTGVDASQKKYDQTKLGLGVGTSNRELLEDLITLSRFLENFNQAEQQIAKSEADYQEATVLFSRHQIRSGGNGVIRTIAKRQYEYVKAGEKIMEIEGTDKVRIEGQLAVQYVDLVRIGMEVTVEPALPSAPLASDPGHRQPVTGIAVTAHPDGPLVVSVAADGARVWDPNLGDKPNRPAVAHGLPHPVGVRCVAATPAAARTSLVITGADDGKVRVWDVSNRDRLPTAPKVEPEEAHTSAVQAVAVSPDGRYFATAAGRDVFVWSLAEVKKLYALPPEHRDSVTSVSFTPQDTLVTASKDNTIKVWKLGTEGAAVVRTLDHRAGAVRRARRQPRRRPRAVRPGQGPRRPGGPGERADGGADSERRLGRLVRGAGGVRAGRGAARRRTQAAVPYTIATAGGDGDLKGALQVWQAARGGGRGSEVGRLITPDRSAVTAAAFSPVRGEPFVAVGTADGPVHLWKPPAEARKRHVGRIVNIDAADRRYVTVRVEMSNKELGLLDHSSANVIIP